MHTSNSPIALQVSLHRHCYKSKGSTDLQPPKVNPIVLGVTATGHGTLNPHKHCNLSSNQELNHESEP
jgi:hypothetical protein